MCGIVGYVGSREVSGVLVDGLKRLEYRGYDSCGLAIMDASSPKIFRSVGRIARLEEKLKDAGATAGTVQCGIGHTRWATHGRPSEDNSHPHRDCKGRIYVAHNGIIENYLALKRRLIAEGHRFTSATDTEVLPHLIESYFEGDLYSAVRRALRDVEGVYGIVVVSTETAGRQIVAARNGPPLVVGMGLGETFIASDVPALLPYTQDMVFLKDGEMAVIGADDVRFHDVHGTCATRQPERVAWTADMAEKEGYAHFMLKEIHEQPRAIKDTLLTRVTNENGVNLGGDIADLGPLAAAERLHIVAMGTSLHAAQIGKFMIEALARVPVEVDNASEYRYRDPIIGRNTVVVGISQSGETADTLAAMKKLETKGLTCFQSAMSSAVRPLESQMQFCTRTPARRSAWHPPKHSRRSSSRSIFSRCSLPNFTGRLHEKLSPIMCNSFAICLIRSTSFSTRAKVWRDSQTACANTGTSFIWDAVCNVLSHSKAR